MDILHIILTATGSVLTLFLLTKIMGNRQMSQLSMFDYITGITIGSIAAEMATALEEFAKPLTAMIVYAFFALIFSIATDKSIKLRRILTGETLVLFQNGKLYKNNLKKARLDVSEFLSQCRTNGYYDISKLQSAILEPNGKISFLPLATQRPVTPADFKLTPSPEQPLVNLIIDGKPLPDNLKFIGRDEKWLINQLKNQNISDIKQVFLANCDIGYKLNIYPILNKTMTRDIFE
ncbi:MAG: DUF421 domain-containing protein [Clostridia bacterium]|jgi:uncharacterized membrane protein YcaP (DUF421 family)|nr:DUF421 domain-containing protein [Clostridia bacterium]MDD4572412.1 DUF421 domain-containing protein [Clostridia bacterium]